VEEVVTRGIDDVAEDEGDVDISEFVDMLDEEAVSPTDVAAPLLVEILFIS
jgi:hypothetical protein